MWISVIGARSSCEASAVNWRVRVNDCSIRSSMSFSVSDSCCSSSRESGTASRADRLLSVMARASSRDPRHRRQGAPPEPDAAGRGEREDHRRGQHQNPRERPEDAFELALRIGGHQDQRPAGDGDALRGETERKAVGAARLEADLGAEVARRLRGARDGAASP